MKWAVSEEKLNKLSKFVSSDDYKPIGKRDIVFKSVLPFLDALGYEHGTRAIDSNKVIGSKDNGEYLVVKVVDFSSDYSKIEMDLVNYLKKKGCFAGILTDGITYNVRLVNAFEDSDECIYEHTFSLIDLQPYDLEVCNFCTEPNIEYNIGIKTIRKGLIKESCNNVIESLLTGDAENKVYEVILKSAECPNTDYYIELAKEVFIEQLKEKFTH